MIKVYIVKSMSGSYDDYHEYIIGAFLSEDKAIKCKDEYERKLANDRIELQKCRSCTFNNNCEDIKDLHSFNDDAIKICNDAKFTLDDDGYGAFVYCKNESNEYDLSEEHGAKIEEIEVEE